MWLLLSLLPAFVAGSLAREVCPMTNIVNLYNELGCNPVHETGLRCPTSYNCTRFESMSDDVCHYKGRIFALGEMVPERLSDPCFKQCMCTSNGGDPNFSCAIVECPETWSRSSLDNCVLQYSKGECCSVGIFCPNGVSNPKICRYNGRKYYEGEKFFPEENSCKVCYCSSGFRGRVEEPFCENIRCNVEMSRGTRLNRNCVPVYFSHQGCCPIKWICPPLSAATTIWTITNGPVTTRRKCKYGNLRLSQNEGFVEDSVRCECRVPPYLTCIVLEDIEFQREDKR